MKTLKVFELFAGIGSQAKALKNLGIPHEIVGISEINPVSIKAYMAIHGETLNYGDITKIDPLMLPDMDLLTYSFPCQDLSIAGFQKGLVNTRSGLLYECCKIIEAKKPTYLLLENVKNLVGKKFRKDFDKWIAYLDSIGYNTYWKVINALDHGVPQLRQRVFAVSIRKDSDSGFNFPEAQKRVPFSIVKEKIDDASNVLYNICPSMMRSIEAKACKIVEDDSYTNCLTLKAIRRNNGGFCHDVHGLRYLSPRESMKLMGFSDSDYEKVRHMSNAQIYHITGNSIVVQVLESIFRNLLTSKVPA
jgi:site-specific DNA-cytosine methylase